MADGSRRSGTDGQGHFARCALLRHPDAGCAGQVFLCLVRCANRLSRLAEELLRPPAKRAPKANRAAFEDFLAAREVEQIHFIGKDIIYFHTLFWPAMLHFSSHKVPDNVYVHGFITVSGAKMSKSRGTGISPLRYLEIGMNPEWLRYYIAAKSTQRRGHRLQSRRFHRARQRDLVGKYVNIASRTAGFITKHFDGKILPPDPKRAAATHSGARCARRRRPHSRPL